MRPSQLGVKPADRAHHHQGQPPRIRRRTGLNARRQGLENGLVVFEVAVFILDQEVLSGSEDAVVGNEGLRRISIISRIGLESKYSHPCS